ncbi:MAG: penicillin-binding protein 1C, partial [candidate division Zixibacteria bacterium]|nr:penicillin-binding protein 1C [candidate division Zixibacteria bacterium]
DVPVEYSGYEPVNYDECYSGAVTVEEALIRSLNVPAVNLYAQLGRHGLYHFLKEAEISTLPQAKEYYGLSLVLGGGEVTLLELTNLYCGLANGGLFRPCRLVTSERANPGKRLLSEEACYILTEMLCQLRRPELPAVWEWSINTPKVAWKTGTSYGHRDAWSIGYTPSYSIGVWAGNFNGKGAPALVGAEIAAPVLFDIFSALDIPGEERWFVQPAGVATRQVCAVSGMFPTEHCPNREEELYIPGISPQQRCNIHCQVLVDKKTGYRLCSHCRHGRECEVRVYEKWPAAIAAWKARNGYPIEKIPPHLPTCTQIATGTAPVIHSPVAGARYKLRADIDPAFQQILLDAQVSNSTAEIFWFLDKELVYSGKPIRRIFIIPTPGWHNLICVDDEGRSSEINITVRQESVIDSWQ